jgi:hypothetical protein
MAHFLQDTRWLLSHIRSELEKGNQKDDLFPQGVSQDSGASAVLVLLGPCAVSARSKEPCLILNKRSLKVKQPGDLCFPGGSIAPRLDHYLAPFLSLPASPLSGWPFWQAWRSKRRNEARRLALLLATGLREGFEEMRLNPFGLKFLGPMPSQPLWMFRRVIYPMVVWIPRQKRFLPNWEVEKIVHIPLKSFLHPKSYACYRLRMPKGKSGMQAAEIQDFPCFVHEIRGEKEFLWGATYRIVMVFLEIVFGFQPPHVASLPVVTGRLDATYLTGTNSRP